MDHQEQRSLDEQFESGNPEEELLQDAPNQGASSRSGNPGAKQSGEEWEEDESYLDDSTGRQMLYWIGGGVLSLVVIAVLFFLWGGSGEPAGDFSGMTKQIKDIESRVTKIEALANTWNMALDRLSNGQQTLIDQNTRLSAKIEEMNRRIAERPSPAPVQAQVVKPAPAPAPAAQPKPAAERRYHVVQAGDTLYSIHKKYGVTLDQLRKLNKLAEHQAIYSGQKIYVE